MNPRESEAASVSLDGTVLRRLREEKRLTQLYVSKVVGVTTDTVSRWENNRYPTMRRENALKLAEALDVPVEELLRRPDVAEEAEAMPGASRHRFYLLALGAGLLVLAGLAGVVLRHGDRLAQPVPEPAAERILPRYAASGTTIPVQVRVARQEQNGFILREILPRGWQLLQSNPPPSSLDNDKGLIRWIVKAGDPRDRIVYLVAVGSARFPDGNAVFRGEVVAAAGESRQAVPVGGAAHVAVAPLHWADQNGDGRIDDGEMLQASDTVDEMAGVHIDWGDLERLWDAGGYRWDAARGVFMPAPVP